MTTLEAQFIYFLALADNMHESGSFIQALEEGMYFECYDTGLRKTMKLLIEDYINSGPKNELEIEEIEDRFDYLWL
jgi:hypothetical protein